ncbi:MAG: DUF6249 domain-containing protein [Mucilaginibacter sp.]
METDQLGIVCWILISLGFFAMIFGVVYLYKRERMAMIERGMDPRRYKPQSAPYQTLKWGLLFVGAGVGLFLSFILANTVFRDSDGLVALFFGLIAIFGGLGLFISFLMEKKSGEVKSNEE